MSDEDKGFKAYVEDNPGEFMPDVVVLTKTGLWG